MKKAPSNELKKPVTLETLKNIGIELSAEQYEKLAFLDIESNCKYSSYEILKLLKILNLI